MNSTDTTANNQNCEWVSAYKQILTIRFCYRTIPWAAACSSEEETIASEEIASSSEVEAHSSEAKVFPSEAEAYSLEAKTFSYEAKGLASLGAKPAR